MNNILYRRILNSIGNELKTTINEQFNVGNMNLNDNSNKKHTYNIFNKNIQHYYMLHKNILDGVELTVDDFKYMDTLSSVIIPEDKNELRRIIEYYMTYYNDGSLNWLDVSNFTEMTSLFYNTGFDGNISKWDVSNVQDMERMFANSDFNGDISEWDVSNVYDMSQMFTYAQFNQDISDWDVSNVVNMNYMFMGSGFEQDISGWNVYNVRYYRKIFEHCNIHYDYKPKKFRY